jgi:alkyl sulfatase BDS1-like metallo-beta-lactamase superfamily hydrolase
MTSIEGYTREDADATLVIPRMALLGFLGRKVTLEQLIAGGKATIKGNPAPLQALTTVVDVFPGTFQIMPGTVTP